MSRTYESEDRLQQKCFVWFWNKYPSLRKTLFAVPNGGARSAREGRLFKETGVVAGVSDMILIHKGLAYCFEMKTVVGVQSDKQKDWERIMNEQKTPYYIIRNLTLFQDIVNSIIKNS